MEQNQFPLVFKLGPYDSKAGNIDSWIGRKFFELGFFHEWRRPYYVWFCNKFYDLYFLILIHV